MTDAARTPVRRQQRGIQRMESILDAAEAVFAAVGYAEATTIAIAARAGISVGSLYQFFPHKEAIAAALVAARKEQLIRLAPTLFAQTSPEMSATQLATAIVDPFVAFARQYPGTAVLIVAGQVTPNQRLGAELHDELVAQLAFQLSWPASGLDESQRGRIATVTLGIITGLLPLVVRAEERERERITTELREAVARYLAPILARDMRVSGEIAEYR